MALKTKITAEAVDRSKGLTLTELIDYAEEVKAALLEGRLKPDDLLMARTNFSSKIVKLTATSKGDDKGKWNVA